jgi:DnaJ like chaperone protein
VAHIWGKMVGGAAGLAIGGPIGGVVGAVAGHAYDRYREEEQRARRRRRSARSKDRAAAGHTPLFDDPTETRRIAFATAIIVLGAKLAKADGQVTREEIEAFKRRFMIQDHEIGGIAHIYDQAKRSAEGFQPYARQIAALFGQDPIMLEELLIGLFEVATADGHLKDGEVEFLREVSTIFGFDDAKFDQIKATFGATRGPSKVPADAYKILGLSRSVPDDAVKKAYRNLVRELHPDRLMASGLPQEFIERSSERLAAVNAAYDEIAKQRGMR